MEVQEKRQPDGWSSLRLVDGLAQSVRDRSPGEDSSEMATQEDADQSTGDVGLGDPPPPFPTRSL